MESDSRFSISFQGLIATMHTGSVLLIALFKLISCQASFLSTFDADRLSIKVRRSASATGIVGESVQLVTDHFIRKNVLDTKQWNKIVHESISSNSTVEVV